MINLAIGEFSKLDTPICGGYVLHHIKDKTIVSDTIYLVKSEDSNINAEDKIEAIINHETLHLVLNKLEGTKACISLDNIENSENLPQIGLPLSNPKDSDDFKKVCTIIKKTGYDAFKYYGV